MTDISRCTVYDRPREDHPCGCVSYPCFTEGHYVDNYGEGPVKWQSGTCYEAWTDTYACREGHDGSN